MIFDKLDSEEREILRESLGSNSKLSQKIAVQLQK